MWCALSLCPCALFATHPGKGDILSCHWLDIIALQYRSALSLQEAANIAGTPPQVCGRSWESIIIPYVCYCGERATVRSNGCIYRSNCYNIHVHKGSHQLFGFLFWQGCYNGHHGAAHYIALLFSHISFVLKISYIQLSRNNLCCLGREKNFLSYTFRKRAEK